MRLVHNSLHDEAAARLRERIFAGEFAPGSFLDEVRLAEQMSISRRRCARRVRCERELGARGAARLLRQ